ncbi:S8/S53 family peptidase [Paenibacillus rhizovicinus]|uniref:S8/S53 family peptidase n=1 Tax=Paenibacillus rhizovicinus TaxID=2704463 RepID=A0A6C0NUI4_9BACL|nr:S8/S53 family peptidase [Paenibacillus rhizovicinus]QHW29413.1 S8/S53 family peptidase [Paenibacillus rhizovicinus]
MINSISDHSCLSSIATIAVIDSGVNVEKLPPGTVVLPGINLSGEGDETDIADHSGHGTAVSATILSVAPAARLLPVKLMDRRGALRDKSQIDTAFAWILANAARFGIGVVCAAFADSSHRVSDEALRGTPAQRHIAALLASGILTVTAAGNWYPEHRSRSLHGMAWPAIIRETVSVGALADMEEGVGLAKASQRLHASLNTGCSTTFFALPGEPGMTSGAAAAVTGCFAAVRQAYPEEAGTRLLQRLRAGCDELIDENGLSWPVVSPLDLPLG